MPPLLLLCRRRQHTRLVGAVPGTLALICSAPPPPPPRQDKSKAKVAAAAAAAPEKRAPNTAAAAAAAENENNANGGTDTLAALHKFYGEIYGDRWPRLWAAMSAPPRRVAWLDPFSGGGGGGSVAAAAAEAAARGWVPVFGASLLPVYAPAADGARLSSSPPPAAAAAGAGAAPPYMLDRASLYPALALAPRRGDNVLDMCAAPGGKSLVLAAQLFGALDGRWRGDGFAGGVDGLAEEGELVCNELSRVRRPALAHVLREHLPRLLLQARLVSVTGRDAVCWPMTDNRAFDRILLDAPCSSERHLALRAARRTVRGLESDEWSSTRGRRNSHAQLALLLAGLRLLAPGGRLVYSTCSVSPQENDGVIARALAKLKLRRRGERLRVAAPDARWPAALVDRGCGSGGGGGGSAGGGGGGGGDGGDGGGGGGGIASARAAGCEFTEHGVLALPDAAEGGCGPIYWAVIEDVDGG